MSLTEAIKAEARRQGFLLAGVTTPEPPPHFSTFQRWLQAGRQGGMAYLETQPGQERRADPLKILPECRSILLLGIRYPDPALIPLEASAASGPTGRVAAYAWGQDYHIVLLERLKALVVFVEGQTGHSFPYRLYTDTGPLLERDLAQRAGLGWIGKNTCLIHPCHGSYFLLAEILFGLDLESDPPFTSDRCGKCTRCIQACPTGCILPDRTLDARRCISYLTIEHKSAIPADLRPLMGNWVFGCDVCQMVCPWNRFAETEYEPAFAPTNSLPNVALRSEITLTPQEFNRTYKHSPLQRARQRRYARNLAVALGNSADASALPLLEQAAQSSDPLLQDHARWAIQEIKKP
jgi:epoxyqueuosine reductase